MKKNERYLKRNLKYTLEFLSLKKIIVLPTKKRISKKEFHQLIKKLILIYPLYIFSIRRDYGKKYIRMYTVYHLGKDCYIIIS